VKAPDVSHFLGRIYLFLGRIYLSVSSGWPRVLRSALWGTDLDARRPAVLSFNANERGFSTAGVK